MQFSVDMMCEDDLSKWFGSEIEDVRRALSPHLLEVTATQSWEGRRPLIVPVTALNGEMQLQSPVITRAAGVALWIPKGITIHYPTVLEVPQYYAVAYGFLEEVFLGLICPMQTDVAGMMRDMPAALLQSLRMLGGPGPKVPLQAFANRANRLVRIMTTHVPQCDICRRVAKMALLKDTNLALAAIMGDSGRKLRHLEQIDADN